MLSDDSMHFVLSEESANALANIPHVDTWVVPPTMTRGAKKVVPEPMETAELDKVKGVKSTIAIAKLAGKQRSSKQPTHQLEHEFRRSKAGQAAIASALEKVKKLDWNAFASNPVFNDSGACRMKLPNAKAVHWNNVLAFGPWCVQVMWVVKIRDLHGFTFVIFCRLKLSIFEINNLQLDPVRQKTLLRYRQHRKPETYHESIFKMFEIIRSQLLRSPPSRQAYMRLIKEISDYMASEKNQKPEDPEDEEDQNGS